MIIDKNTTLEHLPQHKQGFYEDNDGNITVLFEKDDCYIVASFNPDGYANNASNFFRNKRSAWNLFFECIQIDLNYPNVSETLAQ